MIQLREEIDKLRKQIEEYKKIYQNGDKYEKARAERKLMSLLPELEQKKREYNKYMKVKKVKYKTDDVCRKMTGVSTRGLSRKSLEYYGHKPSKLASLITKEVLAFTAAGIMVYGSFWTLVQIHAHGIDNGQDIVNALDQYRESKEIKDNQLEKFFSTKAGKYIEKYSLIYQVDKNLAASVYLNSDGIEEDTYISAYNSVTNKEDEIITTKYEDLEQSKAICAFLSEASKMCKGNPIAMLSLLENGYETMTINIHQTGINIEDYKATQKSNIFNTGYVQNILKHCPDVLTNSWVEDGVLYTKSINMSKGEEYIEQSPLEQSNDYHR